MALLPLVYVDDTLLVLDKPAGLLCVPGRGEDKQDCLSARVQAVYPNALVVHRLDMATSGLVVMARKPEAQRTLGDGDLAALNNSFGFGGHNVALAFRSV